MWRTMPRPPASGQAPEVSRAAFGRSLPLRHRIRPESALRVRVSPPSLHPARPASHGRRNLLRHLVDHHARHGEPELTDRLVGVSLPRVVEADPQPGRYERRRQVPAKGLLFDLLGVGRSARHTRSLSGPGEARTTDSHWMQFYYIVPVCPSSLHCSFWAWPCLCLR